MTICNISCCPLNVFIWNNFIIKRTKETIFYRYKLHHPFNDDDICNDISGMHERYRKPSQSSHNNENIMKKNNFPQQKIFCYGYGLENVLFSFFNFCFNKVPS